LPDVASWLGKQTQDDYFGCNEKNVRLKTYSKYGMVDIKEGLSTNGCKEVKKSVPTALV